jgi:hypothetical protein
LKKSYLQLTENFFAVVFICLLCTVVLQNNGMYKAILSTHFAIDLSSCLNIFREMCHSFVRESGIPGGRRKKTKQTKIPANLEKIEKRLSRTQVCDCFYGLVFQCVCLLYGRQPGRDPTWTFLNKKSYYTYTKPFLKSVFMDENLSCFFSSIRILFVKI